MVTSLRLLFLFVFLGFVQDGLASSAAGEEPLTNAQRLARGLPVAKRPKRLFSSRTESARRGMISGAPGQPIIGTLSMVAGGTTYTISNDGHALSYVGAGLSAGIFQYIDQPASDGPVSLTILNPSSNSPASETAYLAFATNSNGGDLTYGSSRTVNLVYTNTMTAAGSTPVSANYDNEFTGYLETSIFTIDPSTGAVTVSWINPSTDPGSATDLIVVIYTSAPGPNYGVEMSSGTYWSSKSAYGYTPVTSITFTQTG